MVITELYIRNFGKLSDRRFYLQDGIQVISGGNEFGKTTIHAFIRAMLFGMERGRGRAAQKDDFTRYEPWDAPGNYAGVMRFTCGGRSFRLERSFARQTKRESLICEDDGEELSVEHGDLQMLLGGLTPELFDNTVSIGQLRAAPGQELADALAGYAANYYETGGGEYDLNRAVKILAEKKRTVQRAIREEENSEQIRRQKLLEKRKYLEEDVLRLQSESEERKKYLSAFKAEEDGREKKRRKTVSRCGGAVRKGMTAAGAAMICLGIFGMASGSARSTGEVLYIAAAVSAAVILAGVFLLAAGRIRRPENVRELLQTEETEKRLSWEIDRIGRELEEKQTMCDNVREECEEYRKSDRLTGLEEQCRALDLAACQLQNAARVTGKSMQRRVNRRASEIFSQITDGKYHTLETDPDPAKGISVWDGTRRIPIGRLSRGTIEQIYFSIRMSAAEILSEETMPVILDDVFAFYDDKRLGSVLKWLSDQKKQVIIFTCHRREEEILLGKKSFR